MSIKQLEKLYEVNLYPAFQTFWNIVQRKHLDVSYSAVQDFIEEQPITQIFRVKKHRNGNIDAYQPHERIQIDIAVMDKFGKSNNGYKYILFFFVGEGFYTKRWTSAQRVNGTRCFCLMELFGSRGRCP